MRPLLLAALAGAAFLVSCRTAPPPVPPPTVDASDAATPVCEQACAAMTAAGCPQLRSCAAALGEALVPNPANGYRPLACADLLGVRSAADVRARGWDCPGSSSTSGD